MPKRKDTFWEHAEKLNLKSDRFRCKYCKNDFSGGISRIKSHLSGLRCRDIKACEQVPEDIKKAAVEALTTPVKKAKCLGASNRMLDSAKFSIPTSSSHNISNELTEEHKLRVDKHLAKLFLSEGYMFTYTALRSPFFSDFVKGIAEYGPGYELPSLLTLKSQLVPDVSKEITEYVENVKRSSGNTGCTMIVYDDEIFLYTSEGCACLESDLDVLDDLLVLSDTITSIGPKNIVQIIFDGWKLHNMEILSGQYPWICLAECAADVIKYFVLYDISGCPSVRTISDVVKLVVYFIYKYDIKVPLRRVSVQRSGPWGSYFLLKVVLEVEEELKSLHGTLLSTDHSVVLLEEEQQKEYSRHAKLIDYVIHCEEFWSRAKAIAQILLPLFQTHCLVEGIGSTSGYLYEMMERVTVALDKFRDSNCALYCAIRPKIDELRQKIIHPMHAAADFLNPAYMCSENFKENDEMRNGINHLLECMVAEEEKEIFMDEFQQYIRKVSSMFTTQAKIMLRTSHPCIWWDYCGNNLPILRKYALQLLSQPCSFAFMKNYDGFYDLAMEKYPSTYEEAANILMMRMFKENETQMLKPINLNKLGEVKYGEFIDQPFCYDDISFLKEIIIDWSDSQVDRIINDKSFSWMDRLSV